MVTMAMLALISMMVASLISITSLETDLARNRRLHSAALNVAKSGIEHFKALHMHYHDIENIGETDSRVFILKDNLTANDEYSIYAYLLESGTFVVDSIGIYNKEKDVPTYATIRATFQTRLIQ